MASFQWKPPPSTLWCFLYASSVSPQVFPDSCKGLMNILFFQALLISNLEITSKALEVSAQWAVRLKQNENSPVCFLPILIVSSWTGIYVMLSVFCSSGLVSVIRLYFLSQRYNHLAECQALWLYLAQRYLSKHSAFMHSFFLLFLSSYSYHPPSLSPASPISCPLLNTRDSRGSEDDDHNNTLSQTETFLSMRSLSLMSVNFNYILNNYIQSWRGTRQPVVSSAEKNSGRADVQHVRTSTDMSAEALACYSKVAIICSLKNKRISPL